ncbi:VOC family protein [Neobacillus sp. YIM B06451]|uniref:VOC family protein n=1 Tax=Neobacillus sp. YIM B06451 TaxID=3070994 RepID=UPI00292F8224|nr:VOC family protein [Neobacillus sp. YIM B06451]
MRSASPYVLVDNCQEAIEFYQGILGGEVKVLNEHAGNLLHAELHFGNGSYIHFAFKFKQEPVSGDMVRIILTCDSEEEIKNVYAALSEGGKVTVELQDTFFGALHAQVTDKIGINWAMNYFKQQG